MWTHDTNRSRGQLFELHFQTQVTKDTPKNTVTYLIIFARQLKSNKYLFFFSNQCSLKTEREQKSYVKIDMIHSVSYKFTFKVKCISAILVDQIEILKLIVIDLWFSHLVNFWNFNRKHVHKIYGISAYSSS